MPKFGDSTAHMEDSPTLCREHWAILGRCQIAVGDICALQTDAIVNSTNNKMIPGGGVDGSIHEKAGPNLQHACNRIHHCGTSKAVLTKGYNLPAKYIIHTVAPMWQGVDDDNSAIALLSQCYQNCLKLAKDHHISSIGFPAIGTGVLGFPIFLSARIAIRETVNFLAKDDSISRVVFVCASESVADQYTNQLHLAFIQNSKEFNNYAHKQGRHKPPITTRQLRSLIKKLLVTDSDFDAFCFDYYKDVKRRFSGPMDIEAKITLLLELTENDHLFSILASEYPEKTQTFLNSLR